MKILIVEDEKNVRGELKSLLENAFYQVFVIEEFVHVTSQILDMQPDLVLLDLNLPGQNGQEICQKLRAHSSVPIIFLTSDNNAMTELNSIVLGGDDYITKPYLPSLLLARIQSLLKRAYHQQTPAGESSHRGVSLNINTYKISFAGNEEELTKNECKLFYYLMQRKGEVIPRVDIIEYLWDQDIYIDDNVLSVNIARLRNKLERLGAASYIQTKRGVGYQI